MAFDQYRRTTVSAQLLTQLASEHGVDASVCLERTGITPAMLIEPKTEITADQELELVRNLVRALGHVPGIALDAGRRYHLSAHGVWGFAAASSLTFRSAVKFNTHYQDLAQVFVRFGLERRDAHYAVTMDDSRIPEDLRPFLLERDFAAWITAMQEMRPGGLPLSGVEFRAPRPAYADRFKLFCGVEPRFDAAENLAWLDATALDIPLAQGDSSLARLCEEQCRQLLARRRLRGGFAGQVREVLLRKAGEHLDVGTVAGALCVAPRTLRRKLEAEGTSFRGVIDEVREALAEEMLTTANMKLEEVAERLGYSEPSSFIHAFTRWKGLSPTAFRKRHQEQLRSGA